MQKALFHEDFSDALREVVRALGGAKVVGQVLWPEKTMEQSQQLLLACLNPDRKERLTPDQVVLLLRRGRDAEEHAAMEYLGQLTGYEVKPIRRAEVAADLLAHADRLRTDLRATLDALDRVLEPAKVTALRST